MTTSEIELKALMIASLNGDATSHRALLERLSRRLRAYFKVRLASVGRGPEEAEDLVQETILAIYLKRHTYDRTNLLMPWVYAVARYKLIDFFRRTKTSLLNVPIEHAEDVMTDEDNLSTESKFDIRRLLAKLPSKVRCAIEAVKLDGRSVAEAAIWCGISESGVKINIHRGLKAMANAISQETRA